MSHTAIRIYKTTLSAASDRKKTHSTATTSWHELLQT